MGIKDFILPSGLTGQVCAVCYPLSSGEAICCLVKPITLAERSSYSGVAGRFGDLDETEGPLRSTRATWA